MFGFFMYLNRMKFAEQGFAKRRKRMQQFLDEIGIEVTLPGTARSFASGFSGISKSILDAFAITKDLRLLGAFALAQGFLAVSLDMPNQTDERMLNELMDQFGLKRKILDEIASKVPRLTAPISIDDVMTPALEFLVELIKPLAVEEDTCFVAMPFRPHFEDRFATFYRPLLEARGFRCFRAWGGLSSEYHFDLLTLLIEKSGCLLAELTGWNPNVLLEVGYAFGLNKMVFQLGDSSSKFRNPANLNNTATIPYDPSEPGWPETAVKGLPSLMLQAVEKAVLEQRNKA